MFSQRSIEGYPRPTVIPVRPIRFFFHIFPFSFPTTSQSSIRIYSQSHLIPYTFIENHKIIHTGPKSQDSYNKIHNTIWKFTRFTIQSQNSKDSQLISQKSSDYQLYWPVPQLAEATTCALRLGQQAHVGSFQRAAWHLCATGTGSCRPTAPTFSAPPTRQPSCPTVLPTVPATSELLPRPTALARTSAKGSRDPSSSATLSRTRPHQLGQLLLWIRRKERDRESKEGDKRSEIARDKVTGGGEWETWR